MSKLTRAEKKAVKKQNNLLEVKDTCVNCGQHIALDQRFCSYCGGKRIYNRLTWFNLIEDFADRFLNLENSFFKTFVGLFRQPEDVIGGYMGGMRKKYLPAFSYFAIAITVAGIYTFILKNWFLEEIVEAQTSLYNAEQAKATKEFATEWSKMTMEHMSIFMFLLIPFMALISKMVFWNYKQYNLVEHFVIYLYTYSHMSMITTVLILLSLWNSTLTQIVSYSGTLVMIIYIAYVLKRLFKLDVGNLILKTSLFLVVLGVSSCFLSLPLAGYIAYQGYRSASGKEMTVDENSLMGKLMKPQLEAAKAKERKKDSLESLERLKTDLEITPELTRDTLQ